MARYNPSTIIMSDDFEESLKGHTYTEFHQVFEHLSKQGNETIQATLAVMYAGGIIVPKDEKEAARWWWIAASQGDATAQFNLGLLYENGKRTSDFAEASVWYRLSAEQGNAEAQYKLGLMYEQGWGVEKDKTEAMNYINSFDRKNVIDNFIITHTLASTEEHTNLNGIVHDLVNSYKNIFSSSYYFICNNCGYKSNELNWMCPSCNTWETIVPKSAIDIIVDGKNSE